MKSELHLKTHFVHGQTEVEDLYFTSPYKIMTPFVDGPRSEFMQMSASAGLLMGDEFDLLIEAGDQCQVSYISQSYDKVFNTKEGKAKKHVKMCVGKEASLSYMPYPIIPFAGSDYEADSEIRLTSSSTFLYCDIFSSGRTGMGESFQMKRFDNKTRIYLEDSLVFADHTLLDPEHVDYGKKGLWNGYTRNGMLYFYRPGDLQEVVARIRQLTEKQEALVTGVTQCKTGIVLRVLGEQSDPIWRFFQDIKGCLIK